MPISGWDAVDLFRIMEFMRSPPLTSVGVPYTQDFHQRYLSYSCLLQDSLGGNSRTVMIGEYIEILMTVIMILGYIYSLAFVDSSCL